MLVVLLGNLKEPAGGSPAAAAPPPPLADIPAPAAPTAVREAFTLAAYEALIAEGDGATGTLVSTELFCGSINSVAIRNAPDAHPALLPLTDADQRVPAAECRWGSEASSSDFLLIVPPELAVEFAEAPQEEVRFTRRRRVQARVEWLGRSEALSLRYTGVLRAVDS